MEPLPERFTEIKRQLIQGNEERLTESWQRLLKQLATENEIVKQRGPDIIPQIEFEDLKNAPSDFISEIKKRGVAVIKRVVPENEARGYKAQVEEYVKLNPSTKGVFITEYQFTKNLSNVLCHSISERQPSNF